MEIIFYILVSLINLLIFIFDNFTKLIYLIGDPLKYHSHFIATVFDINKIISPMDIITFGRLGTTVKKSYMLCSWNQQEDKAIYFCLEWSGYG